MSTYGPFYDQTPVLVITRLLYLQKLQKSVAIAVFFSYTKFTQRQRIRRSGTVRKRRKITESGPETHTDIERNKQTLKKHRYGEKRDKNTYIYTQSRIKKNGKTDRERERGRERERETERKKERERERDEREREREREK